MKKLWLISLTPFFASCWTTVTFTSSEKDASIYVDGKSMGNGQSQGIKMNSNQCVNVKVEKTGFIPQSLEYCNQKTLPGAKVTKYIELQKDDAYDASILNDYANKDFEVEISKSFTEEEAWKIVSSIVTNYFDNLEMADKATGYLKTSWQSKSFQRITVRTRIIVKQSGLEPLKYKLKLVSEFANTPNQSVKDDDRFKEWDRILRTYEPIISEFQTRLGKK
jgi:hypothetical protein